MIGFKNTNNKVAVVEQNIDREFEMPTVEDILKSRGYQEASKIVEEYLSIYAYPLLQKEKRDDFFIERLRKVRERYFLPI